MATFEVPRNCHVVAFHPAPDSPNGVGGWDWYFNEVVALKRITELVTEGGYTVMYKVITVEDHFDTDVVTDRVSISEEMDEIYYEPAVISSEMDEVYYNPEEAKE